MSGTIRTPSYLMTNEFPDNTSGLITPAFSRDGVEYSAGVAYSADQTASFAPAVTARGTITRCNHATVGIVVTINTGLWVAGYAYGFRRVGAASLTLTAGASVTLLPANNGTARVNGSVVWVVADTSSNTFYTDGDLT